MHRIICLFSIIFCGWVWMPLSAQAPITKNQLLKTFYKANTYIESGNDSMAIATLEEVAERVPRLPITYLRMAEIYDRMGEKGDQAAMNVAVLMYGRYLTLELNESKTKAASERLRVLEDKLQLTHFEDEEEKEVTPEPSVSELSGGTRKKINLSDIPAVENEMEAVQVVAALATTPSLTPPTVPTEPVVRQSASRIQQIDPINQVSVAPTTPVGGNLSALDLSDNIREAPVSAPVEQQKEEAGKEASPSGPTQAEMDAFLAGESVAVSGFDRTKLSRQTCDALPDLSQAGISYLSIYGIESLPQDIRFEESGQQIIPSPALLEGHWVSSLATAEGREKWIFDVTSFGEEYNISLHSESGVLSHLKKKQNFCKKIINLLEDNEFLSNTTQSVVCDQVVASVRGNSLYFTFESEKTYKPSTGMYTWGRTLLENVSPFLPFGSAIYRIGENYLNKRKETDVEANYNIESRFVCRLISEGVMECKYSSKEKKTVKGKSKIISTDLLSFYLYKTSDDYVCFTPMELQMDEADHQALFEQVKQDAAGTLEMNYPLATMYHYGVGVEESVGDAVKTMTRLAQEKNCGRAMAWLATFYFNLAYDDSGDVSRAARKRYLRSSQFWLNKMSAQDMPSWYALKAEMDESRNETDSVLVYYKNGMTKGDPRAAYKLGMCALKGRYTKRNLPMAQKLFQTAADKNYAEAYLQLALMYKEGIGVQKDARLYMEHLYKAIDLGSSEALGELSEAYIRGVGVKRDFFMANLMKEYQYKAESIAWLDILAIYGYDVSKFR